MDGRTGSSCRTVGARLGRVAAPVCIACAVGCNLLTGAGAFELGETGARVEGETDSGGVDNGLAGAVNDSGVFDASSAPGAFASDAAPYDAGDEGYTNLAGGWAGTWNQDLSIVGGATTMQLTQDGASLSGTVEIKGGVCPRAGTLTGAFVAANKISGTFTSDDGVLVLKLESTISDDATSLNGRFLSVGVCLPGAFGSTVSSRTATAPPK